MNNKFDFRKADKLISPNRYQDLKPDVLLQRLGTPPGCTILDLGCGNGFFTLPAAAAMGDEGMIIAADTSEHMLALLNNRLPHDNVQILQVEEVTLDIDTATVDATVAIAVYHEFNKPLKNLAEISRVLTAAGKLMILDWDPNAAAERGPGKEHRISLNQAVKEIESAGFSIDSSENYTDEIWIIQAHLDD